ncbi:ABC-2 type transport system ATP-binding protein/ABC-2 type transport system permease protein [Sinosporangium album]|uniref:ABC-2 type transport system ATP-binding protein/ABC-2 type transport system permease protein n=1 Tax=Sinosporangium album TaxID=504805 RepID=A0A1G8GMR4_9ACTN|nr:ABC transporter ATP-binding protein [Sinosporangium album]SDH95679.1 ABC-2 type transport system ATP-binding protein/ABC-2 type transport system permease protein [Sinosporangium album]
MAAVAYDVKNLVKTYPRQRAPAIDGVTFQIHEGEIFGLLGDNGAGKTTLVRQMVNLLRPDSGTVELFGRDVRDDPRHVAMLVGYMPQKSAALNRLTVGEAIYFTAHLRGLSRQAARGERDALVELWRLGDIVDKSSEQLSGGQRRLMQLAVAMAGDPPVLVLDEPTNDLDPVNRKHVWDVLRDRNTRRGTTVILITHDAVEAEKAIQRVGIVQRGRFTALGTPGELKSRVALQVHVDLSFTPGSPPRLPAGITPWKSAPDSWSLRVDPDAVPALMAALDFADITDIRLSSATLEDLYLHYVS